MVANISCSRPEGEPANDTPSAADVAAYVFLTARELEGLARGAGLGELAEALARTRNIAAQALKRLGQTAP